jgi:hypothetical protein
MEHGDAGVLPSETKGHGKEIEARSRRQNIDRAPMADQASAGSSQCGICSEPSAPSQPALSTSHWAVGLLCTAARSCWDSLETSKVAAASWGSSWGSRRPSEHAVNGEAEMVRHKSRLTVTKRKKVDIAEMMRSLQGVVGSDQWVAMGLVFQDAICNGVRHGASRDFKRGVLKKLRRIAGVEQWDKVYKDLTHSGCAEVS